MSYNPYQPAQPSSNVAGQKFPKEAARARVKPPAILLIVSGALNLLVSVPGWFGVAWLYLGMQEEMLREMADEPQEPGVTPEVLEMTMNIFGFGGLVMGILTLIVAIFVIAAGFRMASLKGRSMAVTAAVLSVIPCFQPCLLFSAPVGIYAIVTMSDKSVANAFE